MDFEHQKKTIEKGLQDMINTKNNLFKSMKDLNIDNDIKNDLKTLFNMIETGDINEELTNKIKEKYVNKNS